MLFAHHHNFLQIVIYVTVTYINIQMYGNHNMVKKEGGELSYVRRKSTFISKNSKRIDERLKDSSYKKRDNINRYGCDDTGRVPARTLTINTTINNI